MGAIGGLVPLLAAALAAPALAAGEQVRPAELRYRAVLFDFYQRDYFDAITRALAYRQQTNLGPRSDDTELLLGGMYLSYGLVDAAGDTFRQLLDEVASPAVRNRAWFHLGRLAYQRQQLADAVAALERIGEDADAERRRRRDLLLGLIEMRRGEYRAAAATLADHEALAEEGRFARFNLGIAALRGGDRQRGRALLREIGTGDADTDAQLALRDRANLALGYAALEAEDAKAADQHFNRVRLQGPYAAEALLGAGWAASNAGNHRRALLAWRTLLQRDAAEPAVQEAYLAAPYSYRQLGAERQAADAYERGIDAYRGELDALSRAIGRVEDGDMVQTLRRAALTSRSRDWTAAIIDANPDWPYLPELLAGHDFQLAAETFRDLNAIREHLLHRAERMDVFDRMVATRRERFRETVKDVDAALADFDLGPVRERRAAIVGEIQRIAAEDDALALATDKEKKRLRSLREAGSLLERMPANEETAGLRQRQRVLLGFQRWLIETDFHPRLWSARSAVDELDAAITRVEAQRQSLQTARAAARERFTGFEQRIAEARAQIDRLLPRVERTIQRQGRHLESLAIGFLQQRRERLREYLGQARFALAQLYDRAESRSRQGPEQ